MLPDRNVFQAYPDESLARILHKAWGRLHRHADAGPPFLTSEERPRVERLVRLIQWEQDRRDVARMYATQWLRDEIALVDPNEPTAS